MTYDEFERVGLDEGCPYGLCKLAWAWSGRESCGGFPVQPFYDEKLRYFFRSMLSRMPEDALRAVKFVDSFELEPGAMDSIANEFLKFSDERKEPT